MESSEEINIRDKCALCKTLDCCPEHCCNWDNCKCNDCEYCKANQKTSNSDLHQDPSILIKSTGLEEIKKIKKTTKQRSDIKDELDMPSEQIRTCDGALIINYEGLDEQEDVVYAGGIKGIRALRQQRDAINHQVDEDLSHKKDTLGNKLSKYEEEKR